MKICIIGTGYVGLTAGTCLADMGNEVICVDNNLQKTEQLKKGIIPIFEPGLEELIRVNVQENRLHFSTDLENAVKSSKACFIAVGTPQDNDGSCDLSVVFDVAAQIAKAMNEYKVIINKSTVPPGTAEKISEVIKKHTDFDFDVVSNPEFLKQGSAVDDFLSPDRVIIGSNSDRATKIMQEIYSPFLRTANRVIIMDIKSAEMTKYTANAFLATKISFINEIANLCEKIGADAEKVRVGITTDKRIGNQFLFPGIGFGGSCFGKDINALIAFTEDLKCDNAILKAVNETNKNQRLLFVQKIIDRFGNDLSDKTIAVWGLAFKPKTNDMRDAPSITIIEKLLEKGAKIQAYDPKAINTAKNIFGNKIMYAKSAYNALENADCMLLLTEWNEFRYPDMEKIKALLKTPLIFDGRNQYNAQNLKEMGIEYICVGRNFN